MSILATLPIRRREFAGFDDPSLPEGIWQGEVTRVGDASGGIVTVGLIFNIGTGTPRDSRFYSLEQLSVFYTDNTQGSFVFSILGMGERTVAGASFVLDGVLFNTTDIGAAQRDIGALLPLFLGRQSDAGTSSNIQVSAPNANVQTLTMTAMGYMWGPRSINALGGPSRPLQGIF